MTPMRCRFYAVRRQVIKASHLHRSASPYNPWGLNFVYQTWMLETTLKMRNIKMSGCRASARIFPNVHRLRPSVSFLPALIHRNTCSPIHNGSRLPLPLPAPPSTRHISQHTSRYSDRHEWLGHCLYFRRGPPYRRCSLLLYFLQRHRRYRRPSM